MRVAVTGGTGFIGRHLTRALAGQGHEVLILARGDDQRDLSVRRFPRVRFAAADTTDEARLAGLLVGCQAVAHCAGINRESGAQTFWRVHVEGTRAIVRAAERAGVRRFALLSFLKARPKCGSAYHESKWHAEEIVRASSLDWTVLKAGMTGGLGDHLLDHLSHLLHTVPVFASVGMHERKVRPIVVNDLVRILEAALLEGRLPQRTLPVLGPEEMALSEFVRRLAGVVDRRVLLLRMPVWAHYVGAWLYEQTMTRPLISRAQVRMLAEGMEEPLPDSDVLPDDLQPHQRFTAQVILEGLPAIPGFGLARR